MPFVRSQGANIYWKVEGDPQKRPLVLLNSIGTDMDLWAEALVPLRREFSLLRIDTRGHGASDVSMCDYELALLAADVRAAMDAADVRAGAIAGVSLGGMIAMQLALDVPGRVTSLVLVCTSSTMDRFAWTARVDKVRAEGMAGIADLAMSRFLSPDFAAERPDVAATVLRGLLNMDPAGYAGCAAAIRDMNLAARLANIQVPTLTVTGRKDSSTPHDGHGEHLIAAIDGAVHVALDAAHLAPLEAPDDLAAAIIDFLKP
ncbi:3-oxoadipate enol-lactonase [Sphingomonas sp. BIUV-7]|uniref:3-oxoadipate enol-lactonase n=1 Tax=Sphingomonas natans TaxID=3063330 RepID=A0ABT8YBT8_9SPHN|nr:3-oxoadipate enol-lactonase [Sphingomonas sp. BIUV-7]MDO6415303.1 3-oxoadipate enol-lactonase [Sphingomonas sp. BIUV-7]